MKRSVKRLLVIVGPTAVGKTAVSIFLARKLGTEIVSADSRQLYREMRIGTARPSEEELAAAPHHFIANRSIHEEYNAARFGEEALQVIHSLFESYDTVIMCGGSGLYVKAVCEGFDEIPDVPEEVREELNEGFKNHGLEWLQEKMQRLDPDHYKDIDQQNPIRLIRALEVRISTGMSIRSFQTKQKRAHAFTIVKIGLELERDELYRRIDARMDRMIEEGLFEEAQSLYPFRDHNALQTVGYREVFDYMEGKYDKEETIRLLKRNTRRYAKRQLTWFKKDESINWFNAFDLEKVENFVLGKS